MSVIHRASGTGDGERIWFNGGLVTIRVSGSDSGNAFNLCDVLARVGHVTPLHKDPNAETFHVVEGELLFHIDGREVRATAGDTVFLPPGTPHAFLVTSPVVRYVLLNVPGGQDAFFRAGGEPAPRAALPPPAAPDIPRINAAAAQAGIEILGPPPFHIKEPRESVVE
jgi:quercetin dioxygenase-like cupin family protein